MDVETKELLDSQEAAAFLSIDVRSLHRHRRVWGLPAYRVGNELRYDLSELRAWIKDHPAL